MDNRVFGFDLDDTLLPAARFYHRVSWDCGMIIDQALGTVSPHPKEIIDFQQSADKHLYKSEGYDVHRFPHSWVLTYEAMARQFGVPVDPATVEQLRATAARFQDGPFQAFPGVHEVLSRLRDSGTELHLISSGSRAEDFQNRKIDEAGLRQYFLTAEITSADKKPAMHRIFDGREDRSYMIGDSKRNDIAPALKLGVTAIWVPSASWNFDHDLLHNGHYHTISSVSKLPALLDRLERKPA